MIERVRFYGDCLGGIGFPVNGGIAVIDTEATPRVLDIVWCDTEIAGSIGGCLKQLIRIGPERRAVVQTRYEDHSKDYIFLAAEIFGVVLRAEDEEGNVLWERPKLTRMDKFRAMSVDEVACIITRGTVDAYCQNRHECAVLLNADQEIPEDHCAECAKLWLLEEME